MSNIIEIKELSKTYKNGFVEVTALKNINLEIKQGEFVAIMGASGSGKSTLMNILGCLDRPTKGTYVLEDTYTHDKTDNELSFIRNQKIGFVFQSFNLISRTSALKNVEMPMIYGRMPAKKRRERAHELLEIVGLGDRGNHMPNQLSGGQRQRVAIARALSNNPPIILADEPTGNLDSKSSEEIMNLFKKLNREQGNTVIVVTHEDDIASKTDRVIVFKDGEIISDNERRMDANKSTSENVNQMDEAVNSNMQDEKTAKYADKNNMSMSDNITNMENIKKMWEE